MTIYSQNVDKDKSPFRKEIHMDQGWQINVSIFT